MALFPSRSAARSATRSGAVGVGAAQSDPTAPPLSAHELDRIRLAVGRNWPSSGQGAHLRRRQGQSLEFREYRDYHPGDDIRSVDWRASARAGRPDGAAPRLVVRSFDAEERMTLAVVLDLRAGMWLPEAAPKLLYALWLMRALAAIVARTGDAVILSTLFGPDERAPLRLRGRAAPAAARRLAQEILAAGPPPLEAVPRARPQPLLRMLRPAGAAVLISDMLFDGADPGLRAFCAPAAKASSPLVICELDTFAAETAGLGPGGARRLAAVEGRSFAEAPLQPDAAWLADARSRIDAHHAGMRRLWARGGLVWEPRRAKVIWPEAAGPGDLAALFRQGLRQLPVLQAVAAGRAG